MSVMIQVQKNTISGLWEVRKNARRVVNTKCRMHAINDAETIRADLESQGLEVLTSFDLTGE